MLRQVRPCGRGLIDYETILPLLYRQNRQLNLTIENPTGHGRNLVQLYDPVWQVSHPNLDIGELAEYVRLTKGCEDRIAAGEWPTLDEYEEAPFDYARQVSFITESAAYLRAVCERHGLGEVIR